MGLPPCILDKGKPVARPGRKAKDQPHVRLAAWLPKGCWFERSRKRPFGDKHFRSNDEDFAASMDYVWV